MRATIALLLRMCQTVAFLSQRAAVIAAIAVGSTSCATIATWGENACEHDISHIYSGTQVDIMLPIAAIRSDSGEAGILVLLIFDLPFSFIADTLTLPFSIYHEYTIECAEKNTLSEEPEDQSSLLLKAEGHAQC